MATSMPIPAGPGNRYERGAERTEKLDDREELHAMVSSGNDTTVTHMDLQQLWLLVHALHEINSSASVGEGYTRPHP